MFYVHSVRKNKKVVGGGSGPPQATCFYLSLGVGNICFLSLAQRFFCCCNCACLLGNIFHDDDEDGQQINKIRHSGRQSLAAPLSPLVLYNIFLSKFLSGYPVGHPDRSCALVLTYRSRQS